MKGKVYYYIKEQVHTYKRLGTNIKEYVHTY